MFNTVSVLIDIRVLGEVGGACTNNPVFIKKIRNIKGLAGFRIGIILIQEFHEFL